MASNLRNDQDLRDFREILSKLSTSDSNSKSFVFRGEYLLSVVKNILPLPYVPEKLNMKAILLRRNENSKEESPKQFSEIPEEEKHKNSIDSEFEVIGSPLDCVFDVSLEQNFPDFPYEKTKKFSYFSDCQKMPVSESRALMEFYKLAMQNSEISEDIPFCILCDEEGPESLNLIGKLKNMQFTVSSHEPCTKATVPSITSVIAKHLKCFSAGFSTVEISGYALYNLAENQVLRKSEAVLKPNSASSLTLECKWTGVTTFLENPSEDTATYTLGIQANSSNESGSAYTKYKEIELLQALHKGIETGKIIWLCGDESESVVQKVEAFMTDLKNSAYGSRCIQQNFASKSADFDTAFATALVEKRADVDFTDKLWILLTGCSSYEELFASFNLVFNELKDLPYIPFVSKGNMTTIANFVREVIRKPLTKFPSLESIKPLEYLLEIGVRKLQKDYAMLFVDLEIAAYDVISPYVAQELLSVKALECLEKLHAIVEHILVCWSYIHLPKLDINTFVRNTLNYYSSHDVKSDDRFQFQVSAYTVRQYINELQPDLWEASIYSSDDAFTSQTIAVFGKSPLLLSATDVSSSVEDSCDSSEPAYYYSYMKFLEDKIL